MERTALVLGAGLGGMVAAQGLLSHAYRLRRRIDSGYLTAYEFDSRSRGVLAAA